MNWKHFTGYVISDTEFQLLSREKKLEYKATYDTLTKPTENEMQNNREEGRIREQILDTYQI